MSTVPCSRQPDTASSARRRVRSISSCSRASPSSKRALRSANCSEALPEQWPGVRSAARSPRLPPESAPEPTRGSARAELVLLGDEGCGRLAEGARGLRPRKEVDVDAPDAPGAELDVAGAEPTVRPRRLVAANARDQRCRDDAGSALGEDACLR